MMNIAVAQGTYLHGMKRAADPAERHVAGLVGKQTLSMYEIAPVCRERDAPFTRSPVNRLA
jgi:hypothetical protein